MFIATQPASQTICEGANATFTLGVGGTHPTYLWKKGATTVSTSAALTINNTTASDAGNYNVEVTGDCGNVISNTFTLTVNTLPTINAATTNTVICAGGANFNCKWRHNVHLESNW